jgi:membrane protease YdiL (CAAX protease family)
MIGAIERADIPSLVLALTGVVPLAILVRRHRAGASPLRAADPPFRAGSPEIPLLVAGALFAAYALGAGAVVSGELGGAVRAAVTAVLLLAGIAAALLARRTALRPRGTFARQVGRGLFAFWAVFPAVLLAYLLCRLFGPEQEQVETLRTRAEGWPWLAVTAVLVAPVIEETCFRGLLYPALRRMLGVPAAIALSSLAFAAIHMPPTVWLPLAILAAAFAWLVETTGSVVPSITAHMALNGLTVATVLLGG